MLKQEVQRLPNGYCLKNFSVEEIAGIKDSLTFPNPKYFQAKKYSIWGSAPKGIPRDLRYYSLKGNHLYVPFGFNIDYYFPNSIPVTGEIAVKNKANFSRFKLELRPTQKEAFDAYFKSLKGKSHHSQIVISTGGGKTILALAIAAKLNVKTLVIVHKTDLLKVWAEDIDYALNMPVGVIQGANRKIEDITIAMIQTLNNMRKNGLFDEEFLSQFDLIIVDEAHHCPASTYDIIDDFKSKYRIGLTATPERNDGLTHVLDLFFGSPCYIYDKNKKDLDILPVTVFIKEVPLVYNPLIEITEVNDFKKSVSIKLIDEYPKDKNVVLPSKQMYFEKLRGIKIEFPDDFNRATMERSIVNNDLTFSTVFEDLKFEVLNGRSCLLFFKQKEEVDWWYNKILHYENLPFYPVKYYGDNSESENKKILQGIEFGDYNITLTTLAKCGEGTNCKAWESVFLISDIGNGKDVEQAVGRARRIKEDKSPIVRLYDYRFSQVKGLNLSSHSSVRDNRYISLGFNLPRRNSSMFSLGYPKK